MIALAIALTPVSAAASNAVDKRSLDQIRLAQVTEAVGVVRYFHPHEAVTIVDWNRVLRSL